MKVLASESKVTSYGWLVKVKSALTTPPPPPALELPKNNEIYSLFFKPINFKLINWQQLLAFSGINLDFFLVEIFIGTLHVCIFCSLYFVLS